MSKKIKESSPYLMLFVGLLLLLLFQQPELAGVFLLIGIVMIMENIWPEQWGKDIQEIKEQL